MCQVCIDMAMGKLKLLEAQRNLTELIWATDDPALEDHYYETYDRVIKELMTEDGVDE